MSLSFVWRKDCLCSLLIRHNNLVSPCHLVLFSHIPDITKNPNLASRKFHCWEPDNLKNRGHRRKDVNSVRINYAFMGLFSYIFWASLTAQVVKKKKKKICLQCGRPGFHPWVGKIPWRREWLPIPVLVPGEFHGQRSLVACSPRGHKESDTTEQLKISLSVFPLHKVKFI